MTGNYGPPEQQPYGQQPQYGQQPGYGQPAAPGQAPGQPAPGYGAPVNPYQMGTRDARSPGIVGIVLAIIAAAALVVSFTAVDWFSGNGKFSDVHDAVSASSADATEMAKLYFGWLAWVLAAVAVIAAIIANLPSPASPAFRAIGALVGVAGIVVTFFAIKLVSVGRSYGQWIKHAEIGFYLALGGFLVATIASLIGPRRRVIV